MTKLISGGSAVAVVSKLGVPPAAPARGVSPPGQSYMGRSSSLGTWMGAGGARLAFGRACVRACVRAGLSPRGDLQPGKRRTARPPSHATFDPAQQYEREGKRDQRQQNNRGSSGGDCLRSLSRALHGDPKGFNRARLRTPSGNRWRGPFVHRRTNQAGCAINDWTCFGYQVAPVCRK